MSIDIGPKRIKRLYVGLKRVRSIYVGTHLAYRYGNEILFNSGQVEGIEWKVNKFTRPSDPDYGYTAAGGGQVNARNLNIWALHTEGGWRANAHVCTDQPVAVPYGATKMKVTCYHINYPDPRPYIVFGLLPTNAANSFSTKKGGQLSEWTQTANDSRTYTLNLKAGMAGSNLYRAIVNIVGDTSAVVSSDVYITKIWFE